MVPTTSWPPMPIDDHQQCHLKTFRASDITFHNPCMSQGLSKPKTLEEICLKIPSFTIVFLVFFSESGCRHISFECKMPSFHVKSIHTQRFYTFNGDLGVTGSSHIRQHHSLAPPRFSLTSSLPPFLLSSTFRRTTNSSSFSHRWFFRQTSLFQEFLWNTPSILSEENSNRYDIHFVASMFRLGKSLMRYLGHWRPSGQEFLNRSNISELLDLSSGEWFSSQKRWVQPQHLRFGSKPRALFCLNLPPHCVLISGLQIMGKGKCRYVKNGRLERAWNLFNLSRWRGWGKL